MQEILPTNLNPSHEIKEFWELGSFLDCWLGWALLSYNTQKCLWNKFFVSSAKVTLNHKYPVHNRWLQSFVFLFYCKKQKHTLICVIKSTFIWGLGSKYYIYFIGAVFWRWLVYAGLWMIMRGARGLLQNHLAL